MYEMTNVYVDLGFWYMARSRTLLGVGLPLIFVPIVAASYAIQDRPGLGLDQRGAQLSTHRFRIRVQLRDFRRTKA